MNRKSSSTSVEVLHKLGETRQARKLLRQAEALHPEHPALDAIGERLQ